VISLFKKKIRDVTDPVLGVLRYTRDTEGDFWEVLETPVDTRNSVKLDFGTVAGSSDGPDNQAIAAFSSYLRRPEKLWALIDATVIDLVANDIDGVSIKTAKQHFYIYSLTLDTETKFEVGFHAQNKDIFVEIFVKNGSVTNMERDDGCCAV
jgi:hypothetical protein